MRRFRILRSFAVFAAQDDVPETQDSSTFVPSKSKRKRTSSSRAREAGEEEEEVVLEVEERLHADRQRPRLDGAVGVEVEAGDAAVRGDVLVLFADRLAQPLDLDLAGQARDLARMQQPLAVL